jgi:hypothetical protein
MTLLEGLWKVLQGGLLHRHGRSHSETLTTLMIMIPAVAPNYTLANGHMDAISSNLISVDDRDKSI